MVDGADICQRPGNLLRLGEVQSDAPCVAVYLSSRRLGMRSVTAGEHNRPTLLGVIARDLLADTAGAADDQQRMSSKYLPQVVPVASEPIGIPPRRLRSLGL